MIGSAMCQGTDSYLPARFLLISLAFYCGTIYAKTEISSNGAGSPAYAIGVK
jgi:hypothetical protein